MSLVPNAYDIPNKLEKTIIPKIVFKAFFINGVASVVLFHISYIGKCHLLYMTSSSCIQNGIFLYMIIIWRLLDFSIQIHILTVNKYSKAYLFKLARRCFFFDFRLSINRAVINSSITPGCSSSFVKQSR